MNATGVCPRMRCPLLFATVKMLMGRTVYADVCVEPPYDLASLGKMLAPGRGGATTYDLILKQTPCLVIPNICNLKCKSGYPAGRMSFELVHSLVI